MLILKRKLTLHKLCEVWILLARSYLEWCETLKWRPFTHLGGYHTPNGVNPSHNHSISSPSTLLISFPFHICICLEFLLLVMLLLYAYGASFGSAMTTINVYLIAISIPHCIPSITLYWFFIFAFMKWTFTLT